MELLTRCNFVLAVDRAVVTYHRSKQKPRSFLLMCVLSFFLHLKVLHLNYKPEAVSWFVVYCCRIAEEIENAHETMDWGRIAQNDASNALKSSACGVIQVVLIHKRCSCTKPLLALESFCFFASLGTMVSGRSKVKAPLALSEKERALLMSWGLPLLLSAP